MKLLDTIQDACADGIFREEQEAASSGRELLNLFDSGRKEARVLIPPLDLTTGPGCSKSTEVHHIRYRVCAVQMDPSGKSKGPPPAVKKVLSLFGSGREEDRMVGYLSFLKIGPKLLKFLPGTNCTIPSLTVS